MLCFSRKRRQWKAAKRLSLSFLFWSFQRLLETKPGARLWARSCWVALATELFWLAALDWTRTWNGFEASVKTSKRRPKMMMMAMMTFWKFCKWHNPSTDFRFVLSAFCGRFNSSSSSDLGSRRGAFSRRHYGSVELVIFCFSFHSPSLAFFCYWRGV